VVKENIALLGNDNKQESLFHSRSLTSGILPQAVNAGHHQGAKGKVARTSAVRAPVHALVRRSFGDEQRIAVWIDEHGPVFRDAATGGHPSRPKCEPKRRLRHLFGWVNFKNAVVETSGIVGRAVAMLFKSHLDSNRLVKAR